MKASNLFGVLAVLAVLAAGVAAKSPSRAASVECPESCAGINNIWPICAIEFYRRQYRLRTFATECEMKKYNCDNGTNFFLLFNGPCE